MDTSEYRTRILLAVDGSEHAWAAAQLINDLPCFETCSLTVMMVIVPKLTSFNFFIDTVLDRTCSLLELENGPQVETIKPFGASPAQTIIDTAHERHADLIVLGARGRRAALGVLLGGVAQQVVEYAEQPVLVVRSPYTGLNRVLYVTDGSPHSLLARQFLCGFSLPAETAVDVSHVLAPPVRVEDLTMVYARSFEAVSMPNESAERLQYLSQELQLQADQEKRAGKALIAEACTEFEHAGIRVGRQVLLTGDAGEEILTYVREHQIDLIVAGSRGLSQVQGWLLGSVSRKLVHYAPCSVLVVREHTRPH
jgi:nucleotide-binding universal stress UspA family protein